MEKITYPLIINRKLWYKFKSKCAINAKPMAVVITELIQRYLRDNKE